MCGDSEAWQQAVSVVPANIFNTMCLPVMYLLSSYLALSLPLMKCSSNQCFHVMCTFI